jgi:hypothetical protein
MKFIFYIAIVFLLLTSSYSFALEISISSEKKILGNNTNFDQANEPIKFNFAKIGDIKYKNFYIENAGNTSYSIEKIIFQNGGYGVFFYSSNPSVPAVISSNESINIILSFNPNIINSFYDTLLIYFKEPFSFIYSVPIEGHSFALSKLIINDTSDFVGSKNFKIPVILKGDQVLIEGIPIELSFFITTNAKVFIIDSISNGFVVDNFVNSSFFTYHIKINNLNLDSSTQIICYLIGKLMVSDQDTTILTISEPSCNIEGLSFEPKNGTIKTYGICVTDISLIKLNFDYVKIEIPDVISLNELPIKILQTQKSPMPSHIVLYNILGQEVKKFDVEINESIYLPLNEIPSGIYKVEIYLEEQKYSKLINVLK